ncbi:MAG: erythromycin esterase family protein, partial [Candidatus Obscuribacterales bacterium]|nr:erythromycin esterase family protein [Candidatus Obscuribacterales bacterium]
SNLVKTLLLPSCMLLLVAPVYCKSSPMEGVVSPRAQQSEVSSWIRDSAITINSLDLDGAFDDLEPLIDTLHGVQVLGVGEATHGTSEFFRLKCRLFEFAVAKLGFRVFGIEADWSDCLPINDYVLEGKGKAEEALCGIGSPQWKCKEILSLIEWMRQYNSRLSKHDFEGKCLYFVGLEQSQSYEPAKWLQKYFENLRSPAASEMMAMLVKISDYDTQMRKSPLYLGQTTDKSLVSNGEQLKLEALQSEAKDYVIRQVVKLKAAILRTKQSNPELQCDAIQNLEVFRRAALQQMSGITIGSNIRDESIALSVSEAIKRYGKSTKVFVWAHNGHVSVKKGHSWTPAGVHLRQRFGNKYYCIGQSFLEGSFLACDDETGFTSDLTKWKGFSVDPPNFDSIESTFAAANTDAFVVDFRSAPRIPMIQTWIHSPHGARNCATGFSNKRKANWQSVIVPAVFDGMTFIKTTTASQALSCSKPLR